MKKLALFFMLIMAIFCFFSCDQFAGPDGSGGQGGTGGSGSGGVITQPEVNIELPTENKPTTEDTKDLLAEAVDLLLDLEIDEGVAKIKEAYADQKNNETALYYALAELASISVDPSVSTLFKDNFGVKNYPAKMNSLISGDWMKEYPITRDYQLYNVYTDEYGDYVRVSGDETSYTEDCAGVHAYFDGEDWYRDYGINYLTNITLDKNGKYLVYYWDLPDYIDSSSAKRYSYEYVYDRFEEYEWGNCVKFSGTKVDTADCVSTWYVLDNSGTWVEPSHGNTYYSTSYLSNIILDENGKYLVYYNNLPSGIDYSNATKYSRSWNDDGSLNVCQDENGYYVRVSGKEVKVSGLWYYLYKNGNLVRESASFTDITVGAGEYYVRHSELENCGFDCSNATKYVCNYKYKQVLKGTSLLPEFNEVSWFKDTGLEEKFGSTHTAYSVMNLMLMNTIECNKTGLNNAIDNMLAIFNSKFANAKALASSISNASVEVPAKVFDAFNLEDLLEEQSDLKIGKAELNVLVASMEIIKGTLEWLASYDWTLNVDPIKNAVIQQDEESLLACFEDVITANTLKVRNENAMAASKASFVSAISLVEESYNYLVGDTSEYPKAFIDSIKEVGDVYLEGAKLLKDAIQNGGVFYIPKSFGFMEPDDPTLEELNKWPTTEVNSGMQIDFGKFFQAGYLSDIFERNAEGKIALYITTVGWDSYEEWGSVLKWHDEPKLIYEFVIPFTSFDTIEEDIQFEIERRGIDTSLVDEEYWSLALKLDAKLVDDLVGSAFMEEMFDITYYNDELYIELY